jgi:hypothetical protein
MNEPKQPSDRGKYHKNYCRISETEIYMHTAEDRAVLVEFGNDASAFQALAPKYFLHGGEILKASEVGLELM